MITSYRASVSLLLILVVSSVLAQEPTVKNNKLSIASNSFDWHWNNGELLISTEAGLTSRSINSGMIANYLFSSSFSPEAKAAYLGSNHTSGNSQGTARATAEYKVSAKRGVYVSAGYSSFLRSSADMNKMMLFGNKQFENQKVEANNFAATAYTRLSAGVSHKLVQTDEWLLKAQTGLSWTDNYNDIRANYFSLFTAANGEYLDLEMQHLAISETDSNTAGGLGLDLAFSAERRFDRLRVGIEVRDLAPTFFTQQRYTYIDSSFRFEGSDYHPIDGSLSTAAFSLDSSLSDVAHTTGKKEVFHLLPMQVNFGLNFDLDSLNSLIFNVKTWDLGFYGIQVTSGYTRSFGKRTTLHSQVSWNTFGAFQWSEGIEYSTEKWCALVRIDGLNGLILPNKPSGYGVSAGLLKRL